MRERVCQQPANAQRTSLLQILKQFPNGPIKIDAVLGDEEARVYAGQIRDILKEAGWTDVHLSMSIYNVPQIGLNIIFRDRKAIPIVAPLLAHAFDSAGIPFVLGVNSQISEGEVKIVIGIKPDSK